MRNLIVKKPEVKELSKGAMTYLGADEFEKRGKIIHRSFVNPKEKPEVFFGLIFYRDGVGMLERCLKSLKTTGHRIIAIDGKFSQFPTAEISSTDEEIELVKDYADVFIEAPKDGWSDETGGQPIKRTQYIKEAYKLNSNSFVFPVDADEVLCSVPPDINCRRVEEYQALPSAPFDLNQLSSYNCWRTLYRNISRPDALQWYALRGHQTTEDLVYKYRHCSLYYESYMTPEDPQRGLKTRSFVAPFIRDENGNNVCLLHYPYDRSEERQKADDIYMENRTEIINHPLSKVKKYGSHLKEHP